MNDKPRCLDLFCKAGGATRGYQLAGFYVVGVDIEPQPRYVGDEFILGNALEVLAHLIESGEVEKFDLIAASPPCQAYTANRRVWPGREYPELIAPTRALLKKSGRPYIIENVEGAPLINPIVLCGTMFGLKVFRHRLFETSFFTLGLPHASHKFFGRAAPQGRPVTADRQYLTVTGSFSGVEYGRRAMGIDWMVRDELSQAIPPAYTRWLGEQMRRSYA